MKSLPALLTATLLGVAASAYADKTVSFSYPISMGVRGSVDESGCENNPGPTIEMDGEIKLGNLKARLIFSNNKKGTHTTTVTGTYDVSLIASGASLTIPKQPVNGGVGGNPYIYIKFTDGHGNDLSDEILLGRCVQGMNISSDLVQTAAALAHVSAGNCSNKGGPTITLDGEITLGGLHATFIFRNNPKGTHTAEDSRDVVIIAEGSKILIPKQPSKGGAGGNPIISLQFLEGNKPLTEPVVLGRCTDI